MEPLFKIKKADEEPSTNGVLNMGFFTSKESTVGLGSNPLLDTDDKPSTGKKRGRPPKKKDNDITMVPAEDTKSDLPLYQTNEAYLDTYGKTNAITEGIICEVDGLNAMVVTELKNIQASKTLKRKYDYISQLAGTSSNLLGTKLTAVKEMNKVITDSHNLELKRIKDLKLNTQDKVDDDKYIMDMYNAFINTPVGTYTGGTPMAPTMVEMTTMNGVQGINRTGMVATANTFDDYVNNMTPTQNMMRLEQDPNVKVAVVYDASTGNRWFDVVNIQTGESIPNVDKPDQMFLEDTVLDTQNGIARNTNLDTTYPLIVINNGTMMEY